MGIPIQNVYYLLCYAWDHLEARDLLTVGADLGDRTENLFAHVLVEGVGRLVRQGLDHGYIGHEIELAGLRGKLLVGDTVKRNLLTSGRTSCLVDDLSVDVMHNRILKAAMRVLAGLETVDLGLRSNLRRQLAHFTQVTDIELDARAFRPVQLHRNIARYGFLLDLCGLLCHSLLPDPATGTRRFLAFTASDQAMGSLFEDFLFHFFRLEQTALKVARRKFPWNAIASAPSALAWLPEMRTDVLLSGAGRRVLLEAKFYRHPVSSYEAGAQPKLRSGHLYQLLAYLETLNEAERPPVEGILLYAAAGEQFDLRYTLSGHPVRVMTLDLAQPWPDIKRALHGVLR